MGGGPPEQRLLRIAFFLLRPYDAPHDADEGDDQDDPDDHVNWSVSAVAPTIHQPLMCKAPHDQSFLCNQWIQEAPPCASRPPSWMTMTVAHGTPLPSHGIGPSHEILCRDRKNRWISGAYFAIVIAICARSSMIRAWGPALVHRHPICSHPRRSVKLIHGLRSRRNPRPQSLMHPQAQTAHATSCPQIWRTRLGT